MCKEYRWVISVASITGAIHSLVWMALGVTGALVYLCFIPVAPYKDSVDFFRVTLVKLYFEGRNCSLDGSYMGKFQEKYNEIGLFQQDLVFGVMVAYVILSAFFFFLSVIFYRRRAVPDKRGIALGWSALSLVICAIDVLFTYAFVLDILTLRNFLTNAPENSLPPEMAEITYIPLTMTLLASRFIAGWLWNFVFAFIIFMDALCCRKIIRKPPKREIKQPQNRQVEKVKQEAEKPRSGEEVTRSPSNYFMPPRPTYMEYKKSMEATTRFNIPEKTNPGKENPGQRWSKPPLEAGAYWHPKPHYSKSWEMDNEGYQSDEGPSQGPDFDHDLKNFESGQRKINIVKPPLGKPVEQKLEKRDTAGVNNKLYSYYYNRN